jgi:hypothetical protein
VREKQPMLTGGFPSFGGVKKGVKVRSHFCAPHARSRGVRLLASRWRRAGSLQVRNALPHCRNESPAACRRLASQ